MDQWRLRLFGSFGLVGTDKTITEFGTVRAAKLLALTALSGRRRMPREHLADLLWPDDFYDATRLRLRQETHRLKAALKDAAAILTATNAEIAIEPELIITDLDAMRGAMAGPNPLATLKVLGESIYGEFLPGWNDPAFLAERAVAVEVQLAFITTCTELLIEAGDPPQALQIAHRMIPVHPFHEPLRLVAMRANAALGSLSSATAEYQQYRRLLRNKREVEPSAELELQLNALFSVVPTTLEPTIFAGHIPNPIDQFFGREEEIQFLTELLSPQSSRRLGTLVGPGGIGKTTVAIEVVRKFAEAYNGRAGFVSLVEISRTDETLRTIAQQIGYPIPADVSELDYLARALDKAPTLLVLDNLEHVADLSQTITELLKAAPTLKLLCTSRRPTKVEGEVVVTLGRLNPSQEGAAMLADLMRNSRPVASTLVDRDQTLSELSIQLDGYPLAIRLAGARLRLLSPSQLLAQLRQSANILSSQASELPERHRSMEVALSWSMDSLSTTDREVLETIATLPGGAAFRLAEQVAPNADLINSLERLVESALINIVERGENIRFILLGPVRDHILRHLATEKREALTINNAMVILGMLREMRPSPFGPVTTPQLRWFDEEHENIQAATDWLVGADPIAAHELVELTWLLDTFRGRQTACIRRIDQLLTLGLPPEKALRLQIAKAGILESLTDVANALSLVEQVQDHVSDDADAAAQAALVKGALLFRRGHFEFEAYIPALRAAVARSSEPAHAAILRYHIGNWRLFRRELHEATDEISHAFAALHAMGDLALGGRAGLVLSSAQREIGLVHASRETMARAALLATGSGDPLRIAHLREVEGRFAMAEGRFVDAELSFRTSFEAWSLVGSAFQMADQLHSLNHSLRAQGRFDEAVDALHHSAELWFQDSNAGGLGVCLVSVANIQLLRNDESTAKETLAFALEFQAAHNTTLISTEYALGEELREKLEPLPASQGPYTLARAVALSKT